MTLQQILNPLERVQEVNINQVWHVISGTGDSANRHFRTIADFDQYLGHGLAFGLTKNDPKNPGGGSGIIINADEAYRLISDSILRHLNNPTIMQLFKDDIYFLSKTLPNKLAEWDSKENGSTVSPKLIQDAVQQLQQTYSNQKTREG